MENKRVKSLEIHLEDGSIRVFNASEEYSDFPLEHALMMTLNDETEELKKEIVYLMSSSNSLEHRLQKRINRLEDKIEHLIRLI